MEKELDRIAVLLGHDVVKPDIRGWQQQGPQAGGVSPSRSPTAGRTQIGSPTAVRTQTSYAASSAQSYQQRYQASRVTSAPTGGYSSSATPGGYSRAYNTTGANGGSTPRSATSGSGSPYAARTGTGSPYAAGGGMRSTTPTGRPTSPSGKRF